MNKERWTISTRGFSIPTAVFIFAFAVVLRVGYLLHKGIIVTSDTADYTGVCEVWQTAPLDIIGGHVGIEYAGFSLPFCVVYELTGHTNLAWIAVQIGFSALACVLVYDATRRYCGPLGGISAGLVLVVLFDSFRFTVYMLSDSTFVFTLSLALWAFARYHTEQTRGARIFAWLSVIWMAITRPFGLPILGFWFVTDLLPSNSPFRTNLIKKRYFVGIVFAGALVLFLLSSRGKWVDSSLHLIWSNGWVFFQSRSPIPLPDLSFDPVEASNPYLFALYNADHLLVLAIVKTLAFFVPALPHLTRNTVSQLNLLVYTPVFFTSMAGFVRSARRRSRVFTTAGLPIVAITVVIAITFVTPFYRYRAPLGPLFAMLTGYLASTIFADWGLTIENLSSFYSRYRQNRKVTDSD